MAPNDKTMHRLEEGVMISNNRAEFPIVILNSFIKETEKEKKNEMVAVSLHKS